MVRFAIQDSRYDDIRPRTMHVSPTHVSARSTVDVSRDLEHAGWGVDCEFSRICTSLSVAFRKLIAHFTRTPLSGINRKCIHIVRCAGSSVQLYQRAQFTAVLSTHPTSVSTWRMQATVKGLLTTNAEFETLL